MTDVILSRGIIDRSRPVDGATPVELIFCNPDLLWRSEFPRPRLGQGAFREAFQAVFKVCRPLISSLIGNPLVKIYPGSHGCTVPSCTVRQANKSDV
jgi:ribonucleotide monophosphatase NagD (HAD superfamily)